MLTSAQTLTKQLIALETANQQLLADFCIAQSLTRAKDQPGWQCQPLWLPACFWAALTWSHVQASPLHCNKCTAINEGNMAWLAGCGKPPATSLPVSSGL